jgi:hypothetical protein
MFADNLTSTDYKLSKTPRVTHPEMVKLKLAPEISGGDSPRQPIGMITFYGKKSGIYNGEVVFDENMRFRYFAIVFINLLKYNDTDLTFILNKEHTNTLNLRHALDADATF